MAKYIVIMSLIFVNCAPLPGSRTSEQETRIEIEFYPFVNKFLQEANDRGISARENGLTIEKMRLENNILGLCYGREKIIRINSLYWDQKSFSVAAKEELMFHELAHCVLGRGHKDTKMETGVGMIPSSVMNYQFFSPHLYIANYEYYTQELFFSSTTPPLLALTSGNDGFDFDFYGQDETIASKAHEHADLSGPFDISNFSCEH